MFSYLASLFRLLDFGSIYRFIRRLIRKSSERTTPMAHVEDVSKRTQNAKHFYDTVTGAKWAELAIHDRHYKDGNNQWQDVNENLVNDTGGFDKKCEATRPNHPQGGLNGLG